MRSAFTLLVFYSSLRKGGSLMSVSRKRRLSSPKKVSLSGLAMGSQQIGDTMLYENSFIRIDEKREINYRKYCELMKKNRMKVKIREV